MVTAHVFFDKGGFFSKKAIEFVEKISPKTHFYYFQSSSEIKYLNINLIKDKGTLLNLIKENKIQKVIFHSLHYFQHDLMKEIKVTSQNKVKIAWVFWSLEFYQLPFNLSILYSKGNRKYLFRKYLSFFYENLLHLIKKNTDTPFNFLKSLYYRNIKNVDEFYSFIENDFDKIFPDKTPSYSYLPYLDYNDIINISEKEIIKDKIMIGHSGSPLLNHLETCKIIEKYSLKEECLFSLSYGNKKYIKEIKQKLKTDFNFNYTILDQRLPLETYNKVLNSVSIFFLNAYCQQGLGNIVYFLNNNTAIYLSEKSSTFNFLKEKGFYIFSIEQIRKKEDIRELTKEEGKQNASLIRKKLDPNHVLDQWKILLSIK